jgi:hypothetical protein
MEEIESGQAPCPVQSFRSTHLSGINLANSIIIIGPAHPLRGGLATFDQRLATAFKDRETIVLFIHFLSNPSFFPGKTQYSEGPPSYHISKIN